MGPKNRHISPKARFCCLGKIIWVEHFGWFWRSFTVQCRCVYRTCCLLFYWRFYHCICPKMAYFSAGVAVRLGVPGIILMSESCGSTYHVDIKLENGSWTCISTEAAEMKLTTYFRVWNSSWREDISWKSSFWAIFLGPQTAVQQA